MRRGNLIEQNFLMFLLHCLRGTIKNQKHPPPAKRHPSTEGNCSIHSPIEGGFRGVCLSLFCFITFYLLIYFQDRNFYYIIKEEKEELITETIN